MAKDKIIVGIDIGSSKVAVVAAELGSNEETRIVGLGGAQCSGLRKGLVVDIEKTAKSIQQAVSSAERMSGIEINSAFVNISGAHTRSLLSRGVVAVSNPSLEIGTNEIFRALQAAKVIPIAPDRQIIHVLPREYIVDGYDGVKDPTGMAGSRLEVKTQIITAASTAAQNILKCIERAGLGLEQMVLSPMASAEAVLFPAEKELGTAVVDIGAGTTEISLYESGSLLASSVLPIGGDYVTSDLAVGLRTPLTDAERVKTEHGCVLAKLMPDEEFITVSNVGGNTQKKVSKKMIAVIMEPRMREFMEMIKAEISKASSQLLLPGGVVLTGGVSQTEGLVEFSQELWDMPVRIGKPYGVGGLEDMIGFPEYATVVGLIKYGGLRQKAYEAAAARESSLGGFLTKIKEWIKTFID